MKIYNADFKSMEHWRQNVCQTPQDVIDKARCLENAAFPIVRYWHVSGGTENDPLPRAEDMEKLPRRDIVMPNAGQTAKTGWFMAPPEIPYIARFFEPDRLGTICVTYYAAVDMDLYVDRDPLAIYTYMGGNFDSGKTADEPHNIFMRVDFPLNDRPVSGVMLRTYLSGLEKYNELVKDVARSLRAACELLSTENRRDNLYVKGRVDINKSRISDKERAGLIASVIEAANAVNFSENKDVFFSSLERARKLLKPAAQYSKRFTLYLIGHSHIDLAWKWRYPETLQCMKETIENQLALMDRKKEYVYVETSAVVWRDLMRMSPEFWAKVRKYADRGQFEPQGAMWCEPDGQLTGAESWFRQIELGQRAAMETCGKKSTCAVDIDAFGFNAALPKILKKSGIDYFVTQKLRYNEYNLFPYIHFWWQGDDGSRVLTLHEYPGHANHIEHDEMAKITRIHHLTDGFYHIPIMWGYGNHGGGPLPCMMDRLDELERQTVFPNIKYSGFTEYFKTIEQTEDLDSLPVLDGELFLETHHKTYTVQARTKELHRECERRLRASESLQAVAGEKIDIDFAWEKQLFAQFHDVISGTSFPMVYRDLYEDYEAAFKLLDKSDKACAEKLLGRGDTPYVFNPLPWRRDAVVFLEDEGSDASGTLKDSRGNLLPWQRTHDGKIVFMAKDLPALGFERYEKSQISTQKSQNNIQNSRKTPQKSLKITENTVSNGVLEVTFDPEKGIISSLKKAGKPFCGNGIGNLKVLEDTLSRDYDTWNFGLTGTEWDVKCSSFEKIEDGPVRAVFRAKYNFGIWTDKRPYYNVYLYHTPAVDFPTSFFEQDFIIYAGDDVVRCVLRADWWEDKKVLKVSADTGFTDTRAFYSIPFGMIERPTRRETSYEKARFEVPAQYFGDLRDGHSDRALAFLNRSKHGYDALGGRIRLSLLTSPWGEDKSKVSDPLADRGRHTIEYAFYPHTADVNLQKVAHEYEREAMVLWGSDKPAVKIGVCNLETDPDRVLVTSVRPGENGEILTRGFDILTNEIV